MPYAEKKVTTSQMQHGGWLGYITYTEILTRKVELLLGLFKTRKKRPFSNFLYRNSIVGEKILDELVYFTNIKQHSIASTKSQLS